MNAVRRSLGRASRWAAAVGLVARDVVDAMGLPSLRALPRSARVVVAATVSVAVAVALAGVTVGAVFGDPCAPSVSAVVCENSRASADDWDIDGVGDPSIQGFATDISVNRGESLDFKIKTDARDYVVEIYRLGWYGGAGARKITVIEPSAPLPQSQLECVTDVTTELYDCGTWAVSATWAVPPDAVSGVYLARLTRGDTGGASHIPFVVRDDASHSALLFQTSDPTWQAYNTYGGSDLYTGGAHGRAYKVSYNRPFATRGNHDGRSFVFSTEYPMIRFLERNGYDVSYTTGVDTDRRGELIKNHRVFLSIGHDEYWSGRQRANVEAARDAGVHLAFFSGNEVYWRIRWEPSGASTGTDHRTMVCYKETWAGAKIDPSPEWTGTFRDPRFGSPAGGGGRPENALTGQAYLVNDSDLALQVTSAEGKLRFWRNTGLHTMNDGETTTLAPHTVGYESDEDLDNGFRPPGLIRLSTTTGPAPSYLVDFGLTGMPGTTTHHLTLYRAASGARVFGAGTIQWAWGLDEEHDGVRSGADVRIQQATVNLLADMGVQPATPMSQLARATSSTDTQPPTAQFVWPPAGAAPTPMGAGSYLSVLGAATDAGGGRVAGVEVSLDGGASWHPAVGTTTWMYTLPTGSPGRRTILARAVDDSANIGPPVSLTMMVDPAGAGGSVSTRPAVPP